jgi:hypothetical protein
VAQREIILIESFLVRFPTNSAKRSFCMIKLCRVLLVQRVTPRQAEELTKATFS